jgi:hypothetical protein
LPVAQNTETPVALLARGGQLGKYFAGQSGVMGRGDTAPLLLPIAKHRRRVTPGRFRLAPYQV